MGLNDEAAALKQRFLEHTEPRTRWQIGVAMIETAALNPAGRALGVGDSAPDFERPDLRGHRVRLAGLLRDGPVVLCFYRGGWCPFCSLELRHWQQWLERLHAAGAELVAIAPEAADQAHESAESQGLGFPVLTDANQEVGERYGLVYELPAAARDVQQRLDAPLDRINADGTWRLPVPATFVVDQGGIIRWAYAEDDYSHRAEPSEVVEAVEGLQRHERSSMAL